MAGLEQPLAPPFVLPGGQVCASKKGIGYNGRVNDSTAPKSRLGNLKLLLVDLLPALLIFSLLTGYQLRLPGLYADEALDVVPAMQLLKGLPLDFGGVRGAYFPLGSLKLPVMNSDYQGVVGTYGVLPFLLGGFDVVNIRLFTICTGLLALVLAYALTRTLLGRPAAVITVLLFAVSPSWVFWSRIGIYVIAQVVPISLAILLCLLRWWRGGRDRWLYAGAFLVGIGFSTKFLFLWLPVALLVSYLVFSAPHIRQFGWARGLRLSPRLPPAVEEQSRWGWRRLLIGGLAFVVGAFPFIWYNLTTRGTYLVLRSNLDKTSYGVNNSDVLGNLYTVVGDYRVLLDGSYFWFQAYGGQPYHNHLWPWAYLVALAGLLLGCIVAPLPATGDGAAVARQQGSTLQAVIFKPPFILWLIALVSFFVWQAAGAGGRLWAILFFASFGGLLLWLAVGRARTWYQRSLVFLTMLAGLIVVQSAVTVSGLWPTHLVIVLPIPMITVAVGIVVLAQVLARSPRLIFLHASGRQTARPAQSGTMVGGQRWLGIGVAVALVAALLATDLAVDASYHADLQKVGGYVTFSDAIYPLNDYLLAQGVGAPIAMDWGFKYNLQVLSGGRTNPLEIFQYRDPAPPEFYAALTETLKNPSNLYLFHVPEAASSHPDRMAIFLASAQAVGRKPTLERSFNHRDGGLVYEVWSARLERGRAAFGELPLPVTSSHTRGRASCCIAGGVDTSGADLLTGTLLDLNKPECSHISTSKPLHSYRN